MAATTEGTSRRIVTIVAAVLVLGLVAAGFAIVSLDRAFDRSEVEGLGQQPPMATGDDGDRDADGGGDGEADEQVEPSEPNGPPPEAMTVLVLGSDTREVLTPQQRRTFGTGDAQGERTETIALLRLDPEADTLRMLNVPRDTLMTRCDGTRGRANAAYSIGERSGTGGMSCVVQSLTEWGDIVIDHAVKVDFRGFVDIVDTVGGVPITLAEPITDERANLDLPAGCTRLDGVQALAFVRARSIDSDYGRIERQQRFVEELRTEILELGILSDLPRLYRTALAVARAVELDSELSLARIQRLVRQHRSTLEKPIEGRSIPGRTEVSDGVAFLEVEDEDVEEAFRWLEGGDLPAKRGYDASLGEPEEPRAGTRTPESPSAGDRSEGSGDAPERC